MAEFKATTWKMSNETGEMGFKLPPEGDRTILIENADITEDERYILNCIDLETNTSFNLSYFLNRAETVNGETQLVPNVYSRGTLVTLGEALAGKKIGVPFFADVIGGVVVAVGLTNNPSKKDPSKKYPTVRKFAPASESMVVAFSKLKDESGEVAQYSVPDDQTE